MAEPWRSSSSRPRCFGQRPSRDALLGILGLVAPGNALAFVDPLENMPTDRKPLDRRPTAPARGGRRRGRRGRAWFPALTQGRLTRFIQDRAAAIGLRLGKGAAEELTKRIGGFSRDRDADLSGSGQLAAAELDKAALYKLEGELSVEDVRALVAEVIPSSAVGPDRCGRDAPAGCRRPISSAPSRREPEPVIIVLLHRRIRELLEFADRLAQGASLAGRGAGDEAPRVRGGNLETQSRRWSPAELEAALGGLLELDATVKGSGAGGSGEHARQLGFTLWLTEFVVRG